MAGKPMPFGKKDSKEPDADDKKSKGGKFAKAFAKRYGKK